MAMKANIDMERSFVCTTAPDLEMTNKNFKQQLERES